MMWPRSFSGDQNQDKEQCVQTGTQEVSCEHKIFFSLSVGEHWDRLPRKVSPLERIKTCLVAILCNML